jgi:adenylate cyclase
MNDYLNDTSYVLQEQYEGWLETYIGDMVCYYWPFKDKNQAQAYQNAVKGALALSTLQKCFFTELPVRYQNKFDNGILQNISQVINAGIGLSSGSVVMGDLGPKRGVRKFGILGDPMNLTARVESLTRHFNTEIIMTADFLITAKTLGYPTRRLGCFCVKGREQPEMLYALGSPDDHRFQDELIDTWENWLAFEEQEPANTQLCPDIFQLDKLSLSKWKIRGLLHNGIWLLEEK